MRVELITSVDGYLVAHWSGGVRLAHLRVADGNLGQAALRRPEFMHVAAARQAHQPPNGCGIAPDVSRTASSAPQGARRAYGCVSLFWTEP